jgi:hypothetical protein
MAKLSAALVVFTMFASAPALAQFAPAPRTPTSRSLAGTWYSSRGPVTFELGGAGYVGTVKTPTGSVIRLSGFFLAGVFMGQWWVEDYSGQRCAATIYDGQHYWGRFRLAFEGGSFTGRWSACEAPIETGEAWGGSNGSDSRPAGPQWIFRDATLRVPAADAFGPGCRIAKADGGETSLEFDIRCPRAGGGELKTTGKLSLDIKRPRGWVPGQAFRSEARLQVTGQPGADATASCRIGLEGTDGAALFATVSASPGRDARSTGEAIVPGPPACAKGEACPRMTIVCTIDGPSPLVMTRIYDWTP